MGSNMHIQRRDSGSALVIPRQQFILRTLSATALLCALGLGVSHPATAAEKIDAAGYTGIRWIELSDWPEN